MSKVHIHIIPPMPDTVIFKIKGMPLSFSNINITFLDWAFQGSRIFCK